MTTAGDAIGADELVFVSRSEQNEIQRGKWRLTRADLLKRFGMDAWVFADGEHMELTQEAAAVLADDLNVVRPWAT